MTRGMDRHLYESARFKAGAAAKAGLLHLVFLAVIAGCAVLFLVINPLNALIASLAVAAMVIVMWRAENGVLLVILMMPLMDLFVLPLAGINVKVSDWAAVLAIGLFLLRYPFDRSLRAPASPMFRPLFVFVTLGVLSSVMMYGRVPQNEMVEGASGLNAPHMRTWMQMGWALYSIVLMAVVYRVVRTKTVLKWSIGSLMVVSLLVALYAISGQRYWIGGGFRVLGTFSEPSYYAEWLVLVLPVAIALTLANRMGIPRLLQYAFVTLLLINLVLTFSTGGFASALLALVLVLFISVRAGIIHHTHPYRMLLSVGLVAVAALAVTAIVVPDIGRRVSDVVVKVTNPEASEHSAMVRQRSRTAAYLMFLDHPLWGVGPGNYPFHRLEYVRDDREAMELELTLRWDPNNLFLEVLSERGILGFLAFVWVWGTFFATLRKGIRTAQDEFTRCVLVGFAASAAGLLLGYWAHANFFRIYIWVMFGLAMAAARLAPEPVPEKQMASPGVVGDLPPLPSGIRRQLGRGGLPVRRPGWEPGEAG